MSTENTPETCCVSSRHCCKCLFLTAILAGLLGGGLVWFLFPGKYTATAWFRAYSQIPYLVFQSPGGGNDFEIFLETQFATIKSPQLLTEALKDIRMAQVKEFQKQKDPIQWLQKNISVTRQGKSELFTISFADIDPKDVLTVTATVTQAYLDRCHKDSQNRDIQLASDLAREKTIFENQVHLQEKAILQLAAEKAEDQDQTEELARIKFLSEKLEQDKKILNLLAERISALQIETRSPARVILEMEPTLPIEHYNREARFLLTIVVGVGLFVLVLLYGSIFARKREYRKG